MLGIRDFIVFWFKVFFFYELSWDYGYEYGIILEMFS